MSKDDFETHASGTFRMISETSLQIAALAGMLEQAKCPNSGCVGGAVKIYNVGSNTVDIEPCSFCSARDDLIKEVRTTEKGDE